jgi:hypothetical protein
MESAALSDWGSAHSETFWSSALLAEGNWVGPKAQLGKRTTLAAAAPVHNTPTTRTASERQWCRRTSCIASARTARAQHPE